MTEPPSQGSRVEELTAGGVAALFRRVLNSGFTGRIIFRNGSRSCSFYFVDGFIVNARTNNEGHRLGEILERERGMESATVKQGLKLGKVRNQPLGMVLLKEKLINPRVLYETLVRQVELISLECAAWEEGTATLYPNVTLGKKAVLLRVSPATALESAFGQAVPAAPPAPAEPKEQEALDPGEAARREELRRELTDKESIPPEEYYRLLGVKPDAADGQVRLSYEGLVRKWHPDRIGGKLGPYDGRRAQALFARINEAYGVLGDRKGREGYDKRRKKDFGQKSAERKGTLSSMDEANRLFKEGVQAMREKKFTKAAEYLKKAAQMDPVKASYFYYLGAAHFRGGKNLKQAEEALLRAIELDGSSPDYYVALGKVYKAGKLFRRAREMFDRALVWDSDNAAALREKRDLPDF